MRTTLDGQILFDEGTAEIEVGSVSRDSIERTVPGLDGVLSVDLGSRTRKIVQKGTLRAKSRSKLNEKMDAISACADGNSHTLTDDCGMEFCNLRIDAVKFKQIQVSGADVVCSYEIIYTQLRV